MTNVQCVYCNTWFDSLATRCPNLQCEINANPQPHHYNYGKNSTPPAAGPVPTPSSNEGGLPVTGGAVPRPRCPNCKQEIDPDCCWCGDTIVPGQLHSQNHSPVPMGCTCGI